MSLVGQLRKRADEIEAQYQRRMEVCATCPDLKAVAELKQCGRCGCLLAAKARVPISKCPLNKWDVFVIWDSFGVVRENGQTLRLSYDEAVAKITQLDPSYTYSILPAPPQY